MREGTVGEGRSRETFVFFLLCFEKEQRQHIGSMEREGSMIWRKSRSYWNGVIEWVVGVGAQCTQAIVPSDQWPS